MSAPIATTHETLGQIWENILASIQPQVGFDTFQRWFAAVGLVRADEQQLTLHVPNNIYQFFIESNYMPLVQSAIMGVLGAPRQVRFVFTEKAETDNSEVANTLAEDPPAAPRGTSGTAGTGRRDYAVDIANTVPGATDLPVYGLNPRYTFDSFVVG